MRNNNQSGPFTIDELLGQNLIISDMLWVEGQSTAWCYLSEIELMPAITIEEPEIEKTTATNIVFNPDDIEKRAEEIRRKVIAYQPQHIEVPKLKSLENARHLTFIDNEEQIEFVDHRKVKSTMLSDISMTAFIVLLFAGGIYGGRTLFNNKTIVLETPTTIQTISDQHAAKSDSKTIITEENNLPILPADTMIKNGATISKKFVSKPKPDTTPAIELTTEISPNIEVAKSIDPTGEIIVSKEIVASSAKDDLVKEEPQKKKGFLKKLFGKKKKEEEVENN